MMAVMLLSCQIPDSPAPAQPTPPPSIVAQVANPTPLPRGRSGRLAYLGSDGNVYITSADGTSTIAVTDDATVAPEGMGLSYHRLSWSHDGRLAFASVHRQRDVAPSKLYVLDTSTRSVQLVSESDEFFFIYIYWAPRPCSTHPACQNLAYLIENEQGIGLHVAKLQADQIKNQRVGIGRPFYFSWSPDGKQILWHTGGTYRYNRQAQLALYDLEQDQVKALPFRPGAFWAPVWSPQGSQWLGVSATEQDSRLQSFTQTMTATLISKPAHYLAFNWSPRGDQVAYAELIDETDLIYGPIHIFDLATGQSRQLTDTPFRIVGFFWSPDGRKLAYLKEGSPGADWWQWRMYDLAADRDRGFAAFTPSFQMRWIISSFNQYAQSHRFWSPDSRYLTYADRDEQRVERIWLVDTWADRGAEPIFIANGTIGIWSWD